MQLKKNTLAIEYARKGKFSEALRFYLEYMTEQEFSLPEDEKTRGTLGTLYWKYVSSAISTNDKSLAIR